jgi:hypothetical protein
MTSVVENAKWKSTLESEAQAKYREAHSHNSDLCATHLFHGTTSIYLPPPGVACPDIEYLLDKVRFLLVLVLIEPGFGAVVGRYM